MCSSSLTDGCIALPTLESGSSEWVCLALSIREVITSHDSSKEQVCHQIGAHVLIDDDSRHLRDVRLEGLRRVWLQHGRTQIDDCPMGVTFCNHWDEVLGVLGVSG
jgi:hypothetical protein